MYKMYDNHWDKESRDADGSLNSSFWTDGECEEEIERECYDEETEQIKPSKQTQEKMVEVCSKVVKRKITKASAKRNEKEYTISLKSPAKSLPTSGYGIYQPASFTQEELKIQDYRDNCTIADLDRQSQEDLSEMRCDEEDDHSVINLVDRKKLIDMPITTYRGIYTLNTTEDSKAPPEVADCKNNCLHDRLNSLFYSGVRSRKGNMDKDRKHFDYTGDGSSFIDFKDNLRNIVRHLQASKNKGSRSLVEFEWDDMEDSSSDKNRNHVDSNPVQTVREWVANIKGSVSGLEERMGDLHVSMSANPDHDLERTEAGSISESFEADGQPGAFEAYIKDMVRSQSENDIRPTPRSFIRPVMDHPHTRHLKKTDPVARYFQYKQDWEMFKPPGQKERKALYWKIKEQLSFQPPPPKPRRIFVPNSYIVPTEKKRSALRWEVRHDLANGLLPPKVNYRL